MKRMKQRYLIILIPAAVLLCGLAIACSKYSKKLDARLHFTARQTVSGINARPDGVPLFKADLTGPDPDDALVAGLSDFLLANGEAMGLDPGLMAEDLIGIELSGQPTYRRDELATYKLRQLYRGFPVIGPGSELRVLVRGGRDAVGLAGEIIDPRKELAGFDDPMDETDAEAAVAAAWSDQGAGAPGEIRDLHLVAVPARQTMAYRAEILTDGPLDLRGHEATLMVDAVDGTLLAIDDRAPDATVRGTVMTNDPSTASQETFTGLPHETFGIDVGLDPACAPGGVRDFRMGTAQRVSVFDFQGHPSIPTVPTVEACANDEPEFDENDDSTSLFEAQDFFVKMAVALAEVDPLMGELVTHGASHTYSWDHHPEVPDIAHRPAIVAAVDRLDGCGGASGKFLAYFAHEDSEWFSEFEAPLWSGLLFNESGESLVSMVQSCTAGVPGLLHEIGHYYDNFNAYGIFGDGGPGYSECCLDRPHEATSMRESIAQLFMLFFLKRLYPDLTYTVGGSCSLATLGTHLPGSIVHQSCGGTIHQLNDTRPTGNNAITGCNLGYNNYTLYQAYWELLFGRDCNAAGQCQPAHIPLPPNYEVRWMEALLSALQMGNLQSTVQLWDNMESFIASAYPEDLAFLQGVRQLHGIEPLPHALDPDCECPKLGGVCL